VWKMAQENVKDRGNSPNDYGKVRTEFWKLVHPETKLFGDEADQFKDVEVGRKFIQDGGYTFEDSRPGRAPRLVFNQPLSRNDYTLSLQHDIPQHKILKAARDLNYLLTDPQNLRLTTTRDNLHEDSVRFSKASWVEEHVEKCREALKNVLNESRAELSTAEHKTFGDFHKQVDERLSQARDWERQALKEVECDCDTFRELRTQYAIEKGRLIENQHMPVPNELAQLGSQREQQKELSRQIKRLEHQIEFGQEAVIRQVVDSAHALREQIEAIKNNLRGSVAWARLHRQMEERLRELEQQSDVPAEVRRWPEVTLSDCRRSIEREDTRIVDPRIHCGR
jgi:hypothetical protein